MLIAATAAVLIFFGGSSGGFFGDLVTNYIKDPIENTITDEATPGTCSRRTFSVDKRT